MLVTPAQLETRMLAGSRHTIRTDLHDLDVSVHPARPFSHDADSAISSISVATGLDFGFSGL